MFLKKMHEILIWKKRIMSTFLLFSLFFQKTDPPPPAIHLPGLLKTQTLSFTTSETETLSINLELFTKQIGYCTAHCISVFRINLCN